MKTTKECIKCKDCELDETNPKKIIIICQKFGKTYVYGQMIPCEKDNKK